MHSTRYYNHPPVDVWAAGMIFAQLLRQSDKPFLEDVEVRARKAAQTDGSGLKQALAGWRTKHSCFARLHQRPADALKSSQPAVFSGLRADMEQLISLFGNPGRDDLRYVTNPSALSILVHLEDYPTIDFDFMFAGLGHSKEAIDLCRRMLCMDSHQRISVNDALQHPFISPLSGLTPRVPPDERTNPQLWVETEPSVETAAAVLTLGTNSTLTINTTLPDEALFGPKGYRTPKASEVFTAQRQRFQQASQERQRSAIPPPGTSLPPMSPMAQTMGRGRTRTHDSWPSLDTFSIPDDIPVPHPIHGTSENPVVSPKIRFPHRPAGKFGVRAGVMHSEQTTV